VDLSQLGCGCVAALYLVSMPGKKQDGTFDPSDDKLYYCDANQVGGVYCPEFDIMEANTYSLRSTPHKCDAPDSMGHYWSCDRGGKYDVDVQEQHKSEFGPGSEYEINTEQPFHVKIDFNKTEAGSFHNYSTTLSQNTHEIVLSNSSSDGYLNDMTQDLFDGMAFAMSSWASDGISWLQHDRCQGTCPEGTTLSFTNLKIMTAAGKEKAALSEILQ